jgi:glycosyltransferase involved in cell wall biosynthesis
MHIVHLCAWRVPVHGYGGSQRVVYWLAKAQVALGHRVTLVAPPESHVPGAEVVHLPPGASFESCVPVDADVAHVNGFAVLETRTPWISTSHGNSPGELAFAPNRVYVSADHARRAGSKAFVHNGVDPDDFVYREKKDDYFLFLARVARRVKGVDVALRLARRTGIRLIVAGGMRLDLFKTGGFVDSLRRQVQFVGEVDDARKAELLAGARALIFPIRWDEPFGLVVAEALMSGTPVITTPCGAMPELVTPDVGFVCRDDGELERAIASVGEISPAACRSRALERFSSRVSAQKYARYYERAIAGEPLEA